jgi:hypothetical protein
MVGPVAVCKTRSTRVSWLGALLGAIFLVLALTGPALAGEAPPTPTPTPTPTPEGTPTPTPEATPTPLPSPEDSASSMTFVPDPTLPQTDTLGQGDASSPESSLAVPVVVLTGLVACAYVLRPNQRRRRVANPTRAPERRRP